MSHVLRVTTVAIVGGLAMANWAGPRSGVARVAPGAAVTRVTVQPGAVRQEFQGLGCGVLLIVVLPIVLFLAVLGFCLVSGFSLLGN